MNLNMKDMNLFLKRKHLLLLSLLSGLLFSLAWPSGGFPLLLFFAFIPLLIIEDHLSGNPRSFHPYHILFYTYPGFFTWNLLTTWWIMNSTLFGVTMAVLFNSLFMSLVFLLYHWTKRRFFGSGKANVLLVFYWISFEYLHQHWDLTWSWLNTGSGFASFPAWVQWYEYTGIFGGAVWIFAGNFTAYAVLKTFLQRSGSRQRFIKALVFVSVILLPLVFSLIRFHSYDEVQDPIQVTVIQPNIDPYTEQYDLEPEVVMDRMLDLAESKADPGTDLLVCPESAIQENIWENEPLFHQSPSILRWREYLKTRPQLAVVTGASTFRRFEPGEKVSETARYSKSNDFHYDAFNTALFFDSSERIQSYHKSRLVVGVERMPFPRYLKFLENYALDLGGTIGSLGISEARTVFRSSDGKLNLGTAICYESVYGEFFSRFVRNGAELMLIITNDGWWGNTPGHRQHLGFASLRAIETRRCIARSANTGISCFVDQRGIMSQKTGYWQPAAIRGTVNRNNKLSFYTRHGDYIGRISSWISLLLIVATLAGRFGFRRKN